MTATLRQVTFNAAAFASATSTPVAASGTVRFVREYGFVSGGQWIAPGKYDAAFAAGAFTAAVYLAVPDDAGEAARYTAKIGGASYPFSLSQGAAADLAALITADTVEDVSAVSQLLATKEDALGNPAVDGYALTSTAAGARSWAAPAAGVTDHAALTSLDYASSGHTGFAASADLTTHTGNTSNPHSTTAAQVGALTQAQADAIYVAIATLASYAQLAAAQTFTKAQTIQGEAANEATGILYVKDSAGNTLLTIRKSTGFADGRVLIDAGAVTNVPGLRITGLPSGVYERRDFSGVGNHELSRDATGVTDQVFGHPRKYGLNGDYYGSATAPSHQFYDNNRAAIDTVEVYPGDTANTSKVLAVRRKTSTSDAIAGRWNAYFSDTTHATRTSAGSLTLIKAAVEVTPLAYDTQDSATQTGILVLHNGTQKRVKIGAADSGGAGQRLLTIDN